MVLDGSLRIPDRLPCTAQVRKAEVSCTISSILGSSATCSRTKRRAISSAVHRQLLHCCSKTWQWAAHLAIDPLFLFASGKGNQHVPTCPTENQGRRVPDRLASGCRPGGLGAPWCQPAPRSRRHPRFQAREFFPVQLLLSQDVYAGFFFHSSSRALLSHGSRWSLLIPASFDSARSPDFVQHALHAWASISLCQSWFDITTDRSDAPLLHLRRFAFFSSLGFLLAGRSNTPPPIYGRNGLYPTDLIPCISSFLEGTFFTNREET